MKIACIALMDNGNFMRHAARGLRDYCGLDAVAYVANPDTYVNIPDETVEPWQPRSGYPDADFYLLNDHTYFYHYRHFRKFPRLVKCNGTFARDQGGWFMWDHIKHDTTYISSPCDWTLAAALPFSIQTIGPLYDHRLIPPPTRPQDKITICHAPTTKHKGTDAILKHLHPYRKDNTIEIDIITRTPWQQAIIRKANAHIFIDQYTKGQPNHQGRARGAFGINTIEALELNSIVLNNPLHPYVHHHLNPIPMLEFPQDLETAIYTAQTYYTQGESVLQAFNNSNNYQSWARRHFDISQKSYELRDWIEWVINHD